MARSHTPSTGRKPSQRNRAEQLLTNILAQGAQPATEIAALARKEGLSFGTLRNAKDKLGFHSFRKGKIWYWSKEKVELAPPPPRPVRPPRALTELDVNDLASKKVNAWLNSEEPPMVQKDIEHESAEFFLKAINQAGTSFETVMVQLFEVVRSFDNSAIIEPFTDNQIRDFAKGTLEELIDDTETPIPMKERLRLLRPQPSQIELVAALTTAEEVNNWLANLRKAEADFGLSEENLKVKDALELRRAQLNGEVF